MHIPNSAKLRDFVVVENHQVANNLMRLVINCPDFAQEIRPGQFLGLKVPGDPTQLIRIPLSFSEADPEAGTIEIIYATVGDATERMKAWKPGISSSVVGCLGNGWQNLGCKKALLVAGGCGITPILGLARWFGAQGIEFDVVSGAQSKDSLYGEKEFMQAGAGQVVMCTDDGSYGVSGFTTEGVRMLLQNNSYETIFTCGPNPMMAGINRLAEDHDIECEVSLERLMTCGFGACNTCNVLMRDGSYKACCKQGPVFKGSDVAW